MYLFRGGRRIFSLPRREKRQRHAFFNLFFFKKKPFSHDFLSRSRFFFHGIVIFFEKGQIMTVSHQTQGFSNGFFRVHIIFDYIYARVN